MPRLVVERAGPLEARVHRLVGVTQLVVVRAAAAGCQLAAKAQPQATAAEEMASQQGARAPPLVTAAVMALLQVARGRVLATAAATALLQAARRPGLVTAAVMGQLRAGPALLVDCRFGAPATAGVTGWLLGASPRLPVLARLSGREACPLREVRLWVLAGCLLLPEELLLRWAVSAHHPAGWRLRAARRQKGLAAAALLRHPAAGVGRLEAALQPGWSCLLAPCRWQQAALGRWLGAAVL
jgi:hypothetical protein